jgi:hypothetical protein
MDVAETSMRLMKPTTCIQQHSEHEKVLEVVEKAEKLASAKVPNAVAGGALVQAGAGGGGSSCHDAFFCARLA